MGTTLAGRRFARMKSLISLFFNTVARRANLSGNESFRGLESRDRNITLDAQANRSAFVDPVIDEASRQRDIS
jgi:non-ribosomal peptide synthetase component F